MAKRRRKIWGEGEKEDRREEFEYKPFSIIYSFHKHSSSILCARHCTGNVVVSKMDIAFAVLELMFQRRRGRQTSEEVYHVWWY